MGLHKGKTNNPNGRPKGTPTLFTQEMRGLLNEFLTENWETVKTDFKTLEAKDRVHFFEKLMSYALPKLQTIALESDAPKQEMKPFNIMDMISFEPDLRRYRELTEEEIKALPPLEEDY